MNRIDALSRRAVLAAPAVLSLAVPGACAEPGRVRPSGGSTTLVVYFTRSGNTRVIAGTIRRALGTDVFEIQAAQPYAEDYDETVERARQERDRAVEPPLASRVATFAKYDTVYLGFPIWGETAPPIIRSFLRAHDLREKIVRPFITHGGYGLGDSLSVLSSHAPGARFEQQFVVKADQERETMTQVKSWLGNALRT